MTPTSPYAEWTRNNIITQKDINKFKTTVGNRQGYARVDLLLDGLGPSSRLATIDGNDVNY